MAAITLTERVVIEMDVIVASKTMLDLSDQRGSSTTQVEPRTEAVARMAAAEVEGYLGSVGMYDDVDAGVGDAQALALAVKLALLHYSQAYSLTLTPQGLEYIKDTYSRLEWLARSRRQMAQSPVVIEREDENRRTGYCR